MLAEITFNTNAANTIRFATSATYPPFESLDANNQIVGFDIDLVKVLCKQIKVQCTFTNQAFDSVIAVLKFKKYDALISGMDITPECSKQVSFTQPYYANSAIVIAQKGKLSSLADMAGKKLGVENGTTHQKYIQDTPPAINTVSFESYQNAILELKMAALMACSTILLW